jgi:hypothetical protein
MKGFLLLSMAVGAFAAAASPTLGDPPAITIDLSPSSRVTTDDPSGFDVAYSVKSHLNPAVGTLAIVLGDWRTRLTVLGAAALGAVTIPVLLGWA